MKKIAKISKIEAKFWAGIKFDEDAKVFISCAPALRLFSQGTTKERAKLAIEDAVESFIRVAHEKKVLKQCLLMNDFVQTSGEHGKDKMGEEYIIVTEEAILQENEFEDIFVFPAELPFEAISTC